MFFVLLADYTFFMAGSFTFFLIALGFFEPRDYRVVFVIQNKPNTTDFLPWCLALGALIRLLNDTAAFARQSCRFFLYMA